MNNETANPIRLVVFDWAGTTIDFGSQAPAAAFTSVFAARGIEVSGDESRAPMGLNKREHLIAMLRQPEIAKRWRDVYQKDWTDDDIDAMYHEFVPLQLKAIEQFAQLVPQLTETVQQLRDRNLQIAGTTGYFRAAAEAVADRAAAAGFVPDTNICADDVPQGRPAPWMIYRAMERLGVYPPSAVVKVGDTVADIQSGLSAGCWSIGVCDSSSLTGLSVEQFAALTEDQRRDQLAQTAAAFRAAGSHAVIDSIADLPALIDTINARSLEYPQVIDPVSATL
ncbi:phosphonoacetaldehyde hydrolase [Rosistilla oblonga]|uniref:phosphonoacetaldehyde hydrolase n=1 Tax=Rosistilla oblonga TaxID=2527990 RepID=UPI003A98416A